MISFIGVASGRSNYNPRAPQSQRRIDARRRVRQRPRGPRRTAFGRTLYDCHRACRNALSQELSESLINNCNKQRVVESKGADYVAQPPRLLGNTEVVDSATGVASR